MEERRAEPQRATTGEVIGQRAGQENIPERWRSIFGKLTDLRAQVSGAQRDLKADAKEEKPAFSSHMADAGTDSYDRDWALGMLSTQQNALYEIEHALARIRDGSYGICEATGKPIAVGRLEAIPWTRFSIEAEQKLEQSGEATRAQLGELRPVPRVSQNQAEKEMRNESEE